MSLTTILKAVYGAVVNGLNGAQVAYAHGTPSTYQWISIAIGIVSSFAIIWAVPNASKNTGK